MTLTRDDLASAPAGSATTASARPTTIPENSFLPLTRTTLACREARMASNQPSEVVLGDPRDQRVVGVDHVAHVHLARLREQLVGVEAVEAVVGRQPVHQLG